MPAARAPPSISGNRARTWMRTTLCLACPAASAVQEAWHRIDENAARVAVYLCDDVGNDGDEVLASSAADHEDIVEAGGEGFGDLAEVAAVGRVDAEAFDLVIVELVLVERG